MRYKHLALLVIFMMVIVWASPLLSVRPTLAQMPNIVRVGGPIVADTIWSNENIYVVESDVTVTPSVILTITAGTVIKFMSNPPTSTVSLIVQGGLRVNPPPFKTFYLPFILKAFSSPAPGLTSAISARPSAISTQAERVYFTSYRDDSVGGDTNGDGNASSPQMGDWGGIVFENRSQDHICSMYNFAIRYSGGLATARVGAIRLRNASPYLYDGEFLGNYLNGIEIPDVTWATDIWDAQGIAYHVTSDLTIPRNQTLTINPGVVVKFALTKRLSVEGTLNAVGSSSQPIIFTSLKDDSALGDTNGDGPSTGQKEDWGGILFKEESRLRPGAIGYAEIRYAGRAIFRDLAAIELENSSPTMHHITFVQNPYNGAQLKGNVSGEIGTMTLSSTDVVYIVRGNDVTIRRNEMLTINPGVKLKMGFNRNLRVLGVLRAVGNTDAGYIVITSLEDDAPAAGGDTNNNGFTTTPAPGDWGGIIFDVSSDHTRNILSHVRLRYGGRLNAGVIQLQNAEPTLNDILFEDNMINGAEIVPVGGTWGSRAWKNPDVVHFVQRSIRIPSGQTLTVSPGVVVKLLNLTAPTDPPEIRIEGGLTINGTATAPVIFTSGRDDSVGPGGSAHDTDNDGGLRSPRIHDWIGLTFASSASTANSRINYATFKYAGTTPSQGPVHGAVRFEGGNIAVANSIFTLNYRGVEATNGASPSITQSFFCDNSDYAVYNATPSQGTVQAANNWWGDASGPRPDGQPCNPATGYGEKVSCGVNFTPWLLEGDCHGLSTVSYD